MGNALGSILPMAIGVAISPVPIIAVILMLFSKRARSNGIAFLVGWVLALVVVGSIVLILANLGKISAGGTPSTLAYVLKLLLGLLFLFMAVRQWRGRPKEGEEPHMPKWMASIDQFTPGKAFGFAAVLAGVNPKNLGLTLAAALSIAQANVSGASPGFFWLSSSSSPVSQLPYQCCTTCLPASRRKRRSPVGRRGWRPITQR